MISGNVTNTHAVTNRRIEENDFAKSVVEQNNEITVLNNPFINYSDIKFDKVPSAKLMLRLTDLSGKTIAVAEFVAPAQQQLRFDLS